MTEALLTPKITPEAMAIIKEGTPKPQTPLAPVVVATPKPVSKESGEISSSSSTSKTAGLRKTAPQKDTTPEVANMVPFSIRLPKNLPQALLKASSDRKLKRQQPYTNQGIVAEALTSWLKNQGYLV